MQYILEDEVELPYLRLEAAQMLEYLNMGDKAEKIRSALKDVIESGDRTTRDLGGEAGTNEFTQALIDRL